MESIVLLGDKNIEMWVGLAGSREDRKDAYLCNELSKYVPEDLLNYEKLGSTAEDLKRSYEVMSIWNLKQQDKFVFI